jgi:hypothetical protein
MAKRFGIGKDTVARIWKDQHLKPWKVDTFKISNDPDFEKKLVDVVGLYLNPPEKVVVFSFDEKTQRTSSRRPLEVDLWVGDPKVVRVSAHQSMEALNP